MVVEAAQPRPRVLCLCQSLPYPPDSGVTMRTFNILLQLQKEFDVALVAFARKQHQRGPEERRQAEASLARVLSSVGRAAPIDSERSVSKRAWVHARSVATGRPYIYYEYESDAFRVELAKALKDGAPSLVHLDSMDLYRWRRELPRVATACTHHAVESQLLRSRASVMRRAAVRRYLLFQASLVEKLERRLTPQFDVNLMMSDADSLRLRELAPQAPTAVVPNGVDVRFFSPRQSHEAVDGRVVFLGPTFMFPNRDAVDFLLGEIWPRIRASRPDASLRLIGGGPADYLARCSHYPGVTVLGHVPDIRPHIAEAQCAVVPLRVGGGTRLKILDTWALGRAIVSSSVGCEGLRAVDGENILVRNEPEAFAGGVLQLLSDPGLRKRLEQSARNTAETFYSWDAIGAHLREVYWRLIRRGPGEDK